MFIKRYTYLKTVLKFRLKKQVYILFSKIRKIVYDLATKLGN